MRSLVLSSMLFATVAFAAEPTCRDRAKRLGQLSTTFKKPRRPAPTRLPLSALSEAVETTKDWSKGLRIVDRSTTSLNVQTPRTLSLLASKTRVEVCVETDQPVTTALSAEATPAVLEPLLARANTFPPADRATVVVDQFVQADWSCKAMSKVPELVFKAKNGRLSVLASSVADTLTRCKCPLEDGERAFAIVTLAADTWDDTPTLRCAPLIIGATADALPLKFPDPMRPQPTLGELLDLLGAAGSKGVTFSTTP